MPVGDFGRGATLIGMKHFLAPGRAVEITTVAQRPALAGAEIDVGDWGDYMRHNRISEAYFWQTPDDCTDGRLRAVESGCAVYVEPNVWVRHTVRQ